VVRTETLRPAGDVRSRRLTELAWIRPRRRTVESLDDHALLQLMQGRPCALVTASDGARELRLLDPRDEASIVGRVPR
jgi:hypothetical protein